MSSRYHQSPSHAVGFTEALPLPSDVLSDSRTCVGQGCFLHFLIFGSSQVWKPTCPKAGPGLGCLVGSGPALLDQRQNILWNVVIGQLSLPALCVVSSGAFCRIIKNPSTVVHNVSIQSLLPVATGTSLFAWLPTWAASASPTLTLQPRPPSEAPSSCSGPTKNGPSLGCPTCPCCVSTRKLQSKSLKYAALLFFPGRIRSSDAITTAGLCVAFVMAIMRSKWATARMISIFFGARSAFNCTTLFMSKRWRQKSLDKFRTPPPVTPIRDKAVIYIMDGCYKQKSSANKATSHPRHCFGASNIFSGWTQSFTNFRPVWSFSRFYSNSRGCCLHSDMTPLLWCIFSPWGTGLIELWLRLHVIFNCAVSFTLCSKRAEEAVARRALRLSWHPTSFTAHILRPGCKTQPSAAHHVFLPAC